MSLQIEVIERTKGVIVASFSGSLDSNTYQELLDKVIPALNAQAQVLVLDMEALEYISSMGISAVLKAKKAVEEKRGTFIMVNLQPQIKAVFEIVKALPSMRVFRSLEEADGYLTEMQRRARLREG